MRTVRKILRYVLKFVGLVAGLVWFFDNRFSDLGILVFIVATGVLFLCGLLWVILDLSDDEAESSESK